MFKQILQAYRTHGVIAETEQMIRQMLKHAEQIFSAGSMATRSKRKVSASSYVMAICLNESISACLR